jgi:DNA-binding XRE family transcriptional regulator
MKSKLKLLGQFVNANRKNMNKSQDDLARDAGVSPRFLYDLERGDLYFSGSYISKGLARKIFSVVIHIVFQQHHRNKVLHLCQEICRPIPVHRKHIHGYSGQLDRFSSKNKIARKRRLRKNRKNNKDSKPRS